MAPKKRWADMTDDDPIEFECEIPAPQESVTVTKHGVRVKKDAPYIPPHKNKQPGNTK